MGKLMRVSIGAAYLVAVDIRKGSPTLGKWVGCTHLRTIADKCGRLQGSHEDFVRYRK